jgi:hypothetical protein
MRVARIRSNRRESTAFIVRAAKVLTKLGKTILVSISTSDRLHQSDFEEFLRLAKENKVIGTRAIRCLGASVRSLDE